VHDTNEASPLDDFIYQEEFGSWMVEAVPTKPYNLPISKNCLNESRAAFVSLMRRRNEMNERLQYKDLCMLTIPSFPNLGDGDFFDSEDPDLQDLAGRSDFSSVNPASQSKYILDKLANPHNRFPTLMRNIRTRRGKKVEINVPAF